MKVILLEDVYKQGVAGELVEVAPGFARNYLIPRELAVKATPGALRKFENLSKKAETRRAVREEKYTKIGQQIDELTLTFPVKAGETGKLYGSVTSTEIADRLNEMLGLELDRRRIGDKPLRELGVFSVPVRLDAGVMAHVRVIVHREDEDPEEAAAVFSAHEAEEQAMMEYEAEMEEEADAETEEMDDASSSEAEADEE